MATKLHPITKLIATVMGTVDLLLEKGIITKEELADKMQEHLNTLKKEESR